MTLSNPPSGSCGQIYHLIITAILLVKKLKKIWVYVGSSDLSVQDPSKGFECDIVPRDKNNYILKKFIFIDVILLLCHNKMYQLRIPTISNVLLTAWNTRVNWVKISNASYRTKFVLNRHIKHVHEE